MCAWLRQCCGAALLHTAGELITCWIATGYQPIGAVHLNRTCTPPLALLRMHATSVQDNTWPASCCCKSVPYADAHELWAHNLWKVVKAIPRVLEHSTMHSLRMAALLFKLLYLLGFCIECCHGIWRPCGACSVPDSFCCKYVFLINVHV